MIDRHTVRPQFEAASFAGSRDDSFHDRSPSVVSTSIDLFGPVHAKVLTVALLASCAFLTACGKTSPKQELSVEKRPLDLEVETLDLRQRVIRGSPVWVSATQVAVTAFQRGAPVEFPEENSRLEVLVVDVAKKSVHTVADDARILDFDGRSKALLIAHTRFSIEPGASGATQARTAYSNLREIEVLPDDTAVVKRIFPAGSEPGSRAETLPKDGIFISAPVGCS